MISRLRHRTQLAAAVIAVGLFATACGSDADSASVAPPTASQPEPPTTSNDGATTADTAPAAPDGDATTAMPVPELLRFTAPLVGGGEFTGADSAGKPTVFWFWAPT